MCSPTPHRGDEACSDSGSPEGSAAPSFAGVGGVQPTPLIKLQKQRSSWRLNPCHQHILTRDGLPSCSCVLRGVDTLWAPCPTSHCQEGFSLKEDGYLHFLTWITLPAPLTAITKSPVWEIRHLNSDICFLDLIPTPNSADSLWGGLCGQSPIPLSYFLPQAGREIQSTVSLLSIMCFSVGKGAVSLHWHFSVF